MLGKSFADTGQVIVLESNAKDTSFFIDNLPVGYLKSPEDEGLEVVIDKNKEHLISAESPYYKKRISHHIQSGFDKTNTVKFSFLYTDKKSYVEASEPQTLTVINVKEANAVTGIDKSQTINNIFNGNKATQYNFGNNSRNTTNNKQ